MRRWIAVIALAACGKGGGTPPAAKPLDAAAPKPTPLDVPALLTQLGPATTPAQALAAIAAQCGAACPCIDPARACKPDGGVPAEWAAAGAYLKDQAALVPANERDALAAALAKIEIWLPPDVTGVPAATNVTSASAWGVVVLGKDGALSVGRAARVALGLDGATLEPAIAPAPAHSAREIAWTWLPKLEPAFVVTARRDALAQAIEKADQSNEWTGSGTSFAGVSPCYDDWSGGGPDFGGGRTESPIGAVTFATGQDARVIVAADAAAPASALLGLLEHADGFDKQIAVSAGGHVAALGSTACDQGGLQPGADIDIASGTTADAVRAVYDAAAKKAGKPVSVAFHVADDATVADLVGALDALLAAGGTKVYAVTKAMAKVPPDRLEVGKPTVKGGLDPALVKRYVRRRYGKLDYCYEEALYADAAAKGVVHVTMTIDPNGQVSDVQATGVDDSLDTCVEDAMKGVEFPKPSGAGGVQVDYPVTYGQ